MAHQKFTEHDIVPGVIGTAPAQTLQVKYHFAGFELEVNLGGELKPRQVTNEPEVRWTAKDGEFFTVSMIDPDPTDPKNRDINHWLVVNIPGNKIDDGNVLAGYRGSKPPEGTGKHRYIFLLYKQPDGCIVPDEQPLLSTSREGRRTFKIDAFADKYGLGHPVAGNFFLAEYDDYVGEQQRSHN